MLETVATFDNVHVAEMAKNMLADRGIEAVLEDEQSMAALWQVSNAIGGVKLRVRTQDASRARDALDHFDGGDKVPDAAVTTRPEAAQRLAAEQVPEPFDEESPTDRTVDRAFKCAVAGLLFFPLGFYALYLVGLLWGAKPPVSRNRRWKVTASILLNLPLWTIAGYVVVLPLLGLFNASQDGAAVWKNRRFSCGNHAITIDVPGPYGFEATQGQTPLGPVKRRIFGTRVGGELYFIVVHTFDVLTDPQQDLESLARWALRERGLKIESTTPTGIDGWPALDVQARYKDDTTQQTRLVRQKLIAFPPHVVIVEADVPDRPEESRIAKRFFKSLRTE